MIPPTMTLSLLEKFLLKKGWRVKDFYDFTRKITCTKAFRDDPFAEVVYPKPTYAYPDLDAGDVIAQVLAQVGGIYGEDLSALILDITRSVTESPAGYSCKLCGQCCRRMRDAYQGVVTREEVNFWRAMGQDRILKFVQEKKGDGYTMFRAWVNPKTGDYFRRCPWLIKGENENRYYCRIQEYKPLKCRVFPFSREQAEYTHCPGFETDL